MSRYRMFRMAVSTLALGAACLMSAPTPGFAQTDNADERQDARDMKQTGRDDARDTKQECKEGDEKSRAECRQDKRDTKQDTRDAARDVKH